MLLEKNASAIQLKCLYKSNSWKFISLSLQKCEVDDINLAITAKNDSYTFSGTAKQKQETEVAWFELSPAVDFIPLEIFTEFPKVKKIVIWDCTMSVVKEGVFTKEFKVILYLTLWNNKIEEVEEEAFVNLSELKMIDLGQNNIEYLKKTIFKNNLKLEVIVLYQNKIKMINPKLFQNLNNIREVHLNLGNICVDSVFKESDKSLASLNYELKECFDNCVNDEECAEKIGSSATELNCEYRTNQFHLWPTFKECGVVNKNFLLSDKNAKIIITGSTAEKRDTTAVAFYKSSSIEFIPLEILTEFPNLNGIKIWISNIPILREGFFTEQFEVIQYLYLVALGITQIEENAITNLTELKWIYLHSNQIESIKNKIFKNNKKLEYIDFSENQIKMINPSLFVNLNSLAEVRIFNNNCVSKEFKKSDRSSAKINDGLKKCYNNCNNDNECASA
jgi:Leucine-rich repeat (LRR) protein